MTNNYLKKAFTVFLTAMILLQVTAAPVAAATSDPIDGAECLLRGDAGFWGGFLGIDVAQCQTPAEDAAENRADIYAQGLSTKDIGTFGTTNYQNQLTYSRNTCLCLVKADTIGAMQNTTSRSAAKATVNQTSDSHYASIQRNVIQQHNAQLNSIVYLEGITSNGSASLQNGIGFTYTDKSPSQVYGQTSDHTATYATAHSGKANVTLVDGSTEQITVLYLEDSGGSVVWAAAPHVASGETVTFIKNDGTTVTVPNNNLNEEVLVSVPDTDPYWFGTYNDIRKDTVLSYNETAWRDVLTAIDSEEQYVQNNSMSYVDSVYDQYNASDFDSVDAQELHDGCSLSTLATDKDSTGSMDWIRAEAATSGLNGDVNSSFTIDYTPATGETFRGDTSVSATTDTLNMSNPTIGADAIVTGTETFRVDLTGAQNITNAQIVLHDSSDDSFVTSMTLSDADSDGTYRAPLPAGNYSSLSNGDTVTASVEATADGTPTRIDIGSWTYAPDGGATVELTGGLYTDWAPSATNGSFTVNTTYDTANADSQVLFVDTSQSSQSGFYTLDGTFTITSMYNPTTGENVNSTTLEDYNTQTTNASLTLDEVKKILDYRDQHTQNWGQTIGGGGTGVGGLLDGLGSVLTTGLGVIAVFLLIVGWSRSQFE